MTSPPLGLVLLALALVLPRLRGGDSPAIATSETERATPRPDAVLTTKSTPASHLPTHPIAPGSSEANGAVKSSPMIRGALRDRFPAYDPNVRATSLVPPSADQPSAGTLDPDIVVLPKVEVTARPLARGLPEAIARWKPSGPRNESKFGTGIHEKDFGKVRASAVTILYIPIFIGFSW